MRYALALLAVALSACRADAPAAASEPTGQLATEASPEPPASAVVSAGALPGEFRVAGVDGQAIDLPYGLAVSIDEDTILLAEGCLRMAWHYRFEAGQLATERRHDLVGRCDRPPNATEETIGLAFDTATAVLRTPANGVDFTGGGHTVTLFSQ